MFHAATRIVQRYGVRRNAAEKAILRLTGIVLRGEAKFRRFLPQGRTEWSAYLHGKRVRFIWDERIQRVITVLPPKRRRGGTEEPG